MFNRRRHNRDVGEATLHAPPRRGRIYFFKAQDGEWIPMVKVPGHSADKPRAIIFNKR